MSASEVEKARAKIAQALRDGTDAYEPFAGLVTLRVPFQKKLSILDFPDLLRRNSQVSDVNE